jgi:hypothetical protein|nr:MAG TPA: hypothetical protein [Caudoviricetes sp.]
MILEVDDGGRLERILLIQTTPERVVDGRRLIGGYRLKTEYMEEVWFDKAVWDVTLISEAGIPQYRLTRKTS